MQRIDRGAASETKGNGSNLATDFLEQFCQFNEKVGKELWSFYKFYKKISFVELKLFRLYSRSLNIFVICIHNKTSFKSSHLSSHPIANTINIAHNEQ